jgi:hypothetical protein
LVGLVTVTPANADVAKVAKRQTYSCFIKNISSCSWLRGGAASIELLDSIGAIFYLQENSRVEERFSYTKVHRSKKRDKTKSKALANP